MADGSTSTLPGRSPPPDGGGDMRSSSPVLADGDGTSGKAPTLDRVLPDPGRGHLVCGDDPGMNWLPSHHVPPLPYDQIDWKMRVTLGKAELSRLWLDCWWSGVA